MKYYRLPFYQYFLDTTKGGWGIKVDRSRYEHPVKYTSVFYKRFKLFKHWGEYEVHYESTRDVIQINLQYTTDTTDWIANFDWPAKYYGAFEVDVNGNKEKIQLKVHIGWAKMYKAMKHQIRDEVSKLLENHPKAEVEIVGHSLGSGLSMLCAQDLNYNLKIKPHLFTFGSTKPFYYTKKHKKVISEYLKSCCKEVYNFKNKCDAVCYCPPFSGFHAINHVCVNRKFNIFKFIFNVEKEHSNYYYKDWYNGIK